MYFLALVLVLTMLLSVDSQIMKNLQFISKWKKVVHKRKDYCICAQEQIIIFLLDQRSYKCCENCWFIGYYE